MTLGMAYSAVHVTDENFVKLYPTLHHPTLLPSRDPSRLVYIYYVDEKH